MAFYEMLHMALYEVVIASGIAAVLIVATIGGLVARVVMGAEEMALLRQARAMRVDMGDLKRRDRIMSDVRARPFFSRPPPNDCRIGAAMSAKVIRDICMMTTLVIALVALRAMLT